MRQQEDSIASVEIQQDLQGAAARVHKQPTPAEVIGWLPKNATPVQQDSAVQAHIKPSKITWSERPDTLHLPGHPVGRSWRDVSLPRYYKESFFSKSPLFHPEQPGGRMGGETTVISETSNELRFQFFLMLQTCLQLSLLFFFYTRAAISDTFIIEQYKVIGWFAGGILVYFLLKILAYTIIDLTFFDSKKNEQWLKSYLFIISIEGLLIFPAVMLVAYFGLELQHAMIYSIIIIVLLKILSFYKTNLIFFRQNGSFLQNILYFCALEITPLIALWGTLAMINGYLKINF